MAKLLVEIQRQVPGGYLGLRRAVAETLVTGQQRIERLKVMVYWQTGQLINDYLKQNPEAAAHGQALVERLAADLNIEKTVLYRIVRFNQVFPNVATWQHLTWSHYRELLTLEDAATRKGLLKKASSGHWPVKRLLAEIKKHQTTKPLPQKAVALIEPEQGRAGCAQVGWLASLGGTKRKVFDLGFSNYLEMTAAEKNRFKDKDLARESGRAWVTSGDERDRWFYEAAVERVVDGDTLLVQVELARGIKRRQYLRFLHVNAPEKNTPAGAKARAWLTRQFKQTARVSFRSHTTDRYDRYLCDIWCGRHYLNQALLERGLAVRV